jgi:hypothetical protein
MTTRPNKWIKSSRCNSGYCVEVAHTEDRVHVRDAKNPDGPVLTFTPEAWAGLLDTLKAAR